MPPGRLPPEVLQRRYAQLHRMVQASIGEIADLKVQIVTLKAENAGLRERLGEKADADR